MAIWTIGGRTYAVKWVHPKTIMAEHRGESLIPTADENVFHVLCALDTIEKGVYLDKPETGSDDAIAKAAVRAVGDVLTNARARIEFLRLVKSYPFGQEPGAIGLDGGGDPRANPNQQDKATGGARINQGHLLQPGAFPEDAKPIDTESDDAKAAVAEFKAAALKAHLDAVDDGEATRTVDLTRAPPLNPPLARDLTGPTGALGVSCPGAVGVAADDLPHKMNLEPGELILGTDDEQQGGHGDDGQPGESPATPSTDATPPKPANNGGV